MSVISNIHTAIVYEAKGANQTKPQFGQRLIVTKAKADKNGNYGPHLQQTMATSIPTLSRGDISFDDVKVQDACVDYFKSIQNQMVSERIKEGKKDITTAELSVQSIIEYLNESTSSGEKWTVEKIAEWFTDSLAELIGVALIEKGFDDTKLESALNAYSKLISESLGSKAVIPTKKAEAIKKALDFADINDPIVSKFQARIAKSLKVVDMDELLGL